MQLFLELSLLLIEGTIDIVKVGEVTHAVVVNDLLAVAVDSEDDLDTVLLDPVDNQQEE